MAAPQVQHTFENEYHSAGTQDGYVFGITVTDTAATIVVNDDFFLGGSVLGFCQFTVHTDFTTPNPLIPRDTASPVDPPIFTELILVLRTATALHVPGGTLTVYFRQNQSFANPSQGVSVDPDEVVFTATVQPNIAADSQIRMNFSLAGTMSKISPYYLKSNWNGKLTFGLRFKSNDSLTTLELAADEHASIEGPRLETTAVSFFTGKEGDEDAWSRADRCPRCGTIDVRENFVPDGWSKGLLVCKDCYDPEDWVPRKIPPDERPIND